MNAAIDVSDLPRLYPDTRPSPLWWGIAGLIAVEATVFSSMIGSYFYLQLAGGPWPGRGLAPPPLLFPTINTVLLLISSASMYWAGRAIARDNSRLLTFGISVSVALAFAVLVLRAFEFRAVGFSWRDHAYGSIYWMIMGTHFTHVLASLLGTAAVGVLAWKGYFNQQRRLAVALDTMYWYFVALVWVPLYIVLYWTPRWM